MPTVGLYLSTSGVPKGDCGIELERMCETSYDLAFGFASSGAQRDQVAEPRWLAMPISSPAGQRACANAAVEAIAVPANIASASTVLDMTLLPLRDLSAAQFSAQLLIRLLGVRKCLRQFGEVVFGYRTQPVTPL